MSSKRVLRIDHVITRLILGGAQENTIATVLGLHQRPGLSVRLLSGLTSGAEGTLEPLVESVPGLLTLVPSLVRPVRPWHDLFALRDLTASFRNFHPEIVHTHSGKAGVLGRIAAHRARVPLIIHTIHGPSFGRFQGMAANGLFRAAERWAARHTHHFISVAQAMTSQYLAEGIGQPSQYTRIFSGFPLERFLAAENNPALRQQLGLSPEHLVVGKLARLSPLKGHDDLLDVAADVVRAEPNARFLWVGDGPLRGALESKIHALGLRDRFILTGLIPPGEVPAYLGIMDLLVHLSYREGLPRALPQALAAAKPVVAYDCDGASEVCVHGKTGFLVPVGDRSALTIHLKTLLAHGELRTEFGRAGRAMVAECFPEKRMVDEIHALYLRLTGDSH